MKHLREQHGSRFLLLDGGGNGDNGDEMGRNTAATLARAMSMLDYDVIALGEEEVSFGRAFLEESLLHPELELPIVSANAVVEEDGKRLAPAVRVLDVGEARIGVIALASDEVDTHFVKERHPGLATLPPRPLAETLVRELEPSCDLIVVLAHIGKERSQDLGRRLAGLGTKTPLFILASRVPTAEKNPWGPAPVAPGSRVYSAGVGALGQWLGVFHVQLDLRAGLYSVDTASRELVQGVVREDPEMRAIIDEYNRGLDRFVVKSLPLRNRLLAELAGEGPRYQGTASCFPCHDAILKHHLGTPHGRAFRAIEKVPARKHNPHCLECHTTGFAMVDVPDSEVRQAIWADVDVGCEACHGPAGRHPRDPMNPEARRGFRAVTAEVCTRCHNAEQTPDFDFDRFWGRIVHPGMKPSEDSGDGR